MAIVRSVSTTDVIDKWLKENEKSPTRVFVAGYMWFTENQAEFNRLKEENLKLRKALDHYIFALAENNLRGVDVVLDKKKL